MITDRSGAVSPDVAVKLPVRCVTTANVSLSGTPTIDGVVTAVDDRVLVKAQTDATENGVYDVSVGAWSRSPDCSDAYAFVKGTLVLCIEGDTNSDQFWSVSTVDPVVGSTNLDFESIGLSGSQGEKGDKGDQGNAGATGAAGAGYGGTSSTSFSLTTGSKTITTQAGLAYQAGARVRSTYTSDTTKYAEGVVTAYTGTSLTFTADLVNGSGTFANWNLNLAGDKGTTGSTGSTGATGATGSTGAKGDTGDAGPPGFAFHFTFDTGTTASNPGSGQVSVSNADLSLATSLYINETNADSVSIAAILANIDTCTASRKGTLRLISQTNQTQWIMYGITGVTDNGAWQTVAVSYIGGSVTSFADGLDLYVQFERATDVPGAAGKQTLAFPATAIYPATTSGCAAVAQGESSTSKINYKYLAFDASTIEYASFLVSMPKRYNASTLTARALWTHPSTATNFDVVWQFEILALSDNNAIDTALGTAVTVTDTGGTTETLYRTDETGAITPGNTAAKEDTFVVRVSRKASDVADTLAVDAYLLGVNLYYTSDAGSDD